jgi:hypothetical protein
MRSIRLVARFGSAAAVAGLALAGALAPVSAASAATAQPAKLPTHLFIRAHAVPKTHHKTFAIIGLLRSHGHGLAGETVYLVSKVPHTTPVVDGSATTGPHGLVKFVVTPTQRTFYALVFKGTAIYRRSHSAVIVLPRPRV